MSIEAMKQALEALEWIQLGMGCKDIEAPIASLRQAIQEEALRNVARLGQEIEQEPVAWGVFEGNLHDMFFTQKDAKDMARLKGDHAEVKPLYTTPQPQRCINCESLEQQNTWLDQKLAEFEKREWVGLTLEDKQEFVAQDFGGSRLDAMDWAEKRLKEKNT